MITFYCSNCGTQLRVSADMAGVTGPCPECSASISAPLPAGVAGSAGAAAVPPPAETSPRQPAAPEPQPAPQPTVRNRRTRKPRARWMRVVFPLVVLVAAAVVVLAVLQFLGKINLWNYGPENGGPSGKKPATEASPTPSVRDNGVPFPVPGDPGAGTLPAQTSPLPGDFLEKPKPSVIESTHEAGEFPELRLPSASPANPGDGGGSPDESPGTASKPLPPGPPSAATTDATASRPNPPKTGSLANQNLNAFLNSKTLDERLALMSKSRHSRKELMSSCLAGPLREVKSVHMVEMVSSAENVTQYFYFVDFVDPGSDYQRQHIVMQVVERPGVHPPLVHGDAFIEHYEKKFAEYAKHPNKDTTTFHCIAEARTADLGKDIPKKLKPNFVRLVIRSHPYGAPMFDAYLNKKSPLMEHIGPRKEFPYTQARFCILSFRWNTTDPDHPYIELTDIICRGWER